MDKSDVKGWGSTPGLHWKLPVLSAGEVSGIPSGNADWIYDISDELRTHLRENDLLKYLTW